VLTVRRLYDGSVQWLSGPPDGVPDCVMLADVQYPTPWLPVGLIAVVVIGTAVSPGPRSVRVVAAVALIALVIIGYAVLPQVLDVDRL